MAIISFSNKFIFVKTRKVGGTSVEGMLRRVCGAQDVVTPVTPVDEVELQKRGLAARNYAERAEDEDAFNTLINNGRTEEAMEFLRKTPKTYVNHARASRIKKIVGPRTWGEFYTFSIERHPYSFTASCLNFKPWLYNSGIAPDGEPQSLSKTLQKMIDENRLDNFFNTKKYLDNNGEVMVDRVIQYENLVEDLGAVLEEIGIDPDLANELPNFKSLQRFTPEDAKAEFTDSQLEYIYNATRHTFENFNYKA